MPWRNEPKSGEPTDRHRNAVHGTRERHQRLQWPAAEQAREASQAQAPRAPPEPAQPQACAPSRGARMSKERKRMRARAMRRAVSLWTVLAAAAALLAIGAAQASAEPEITAFELERSTAQAGGHPNIFLRLSFTTKEQERNEQLENPK